MFLEFIWESGASDNLEKNMLSNYVFYVGSWVLNVGWRLLATSLLEAPVTKAEKRVIRHRLRRSNGERIRIGTLSEKGTSQGYTSSRTEYQDVNIFNEKLVNADRPVTASSGASRTSFYAESLLAEENGDSSRPSASLLASRRSSVFRSSTLRGNNMGPVSLVESHVDMTSARTIISRFRTRSVASSLSSCSRGEEEGERYGQNREIDEDGVGEEKEENGDGQGDGGRGYGVGNEGTERVDRGDVFGSLQDGLRRRGSKQRDNDPF